MDILLSVAGDETGWWVTNDLDRFDPHTIEAVVDEIAGWRIPRGRAQQIVDTCDRDARTPAEVRASYSGSVGNLSLDATEHYQAVLDLFEGIDRP